jgi:2-keto-3-deoxy-L-rhamnonate aldolase RhmA
MNVKKIRTQLKEGKVVIGTGILELRVPSIAQIFATLGYQFLVIDCEHGSYNMETVEDITRVARNVGIVPIIRVAEEAYHLIARFLDLGAQGIIIPHVEERKQIEKAKEAIRYAPLGKRGVALGIAHNDFQTVNAEEYRDKANKEILLIAQIESEYAVNNLDQIINKGNDIDVLMVGPMDMSFTVGMPGQLESSKVKEMLLEVLNKAKEYNIPAAYSDPDINRVKYWIEQGYQLIWYSAGFGFLSQKAKEDFDLLQNYLEEICKENK